MPTVLVPLAAGNIAAAEFSPLRRSLPAPAHDGPPAARSAFKTAMLTVAGIVVFLDIEFALAYLLYFAISLAG